MQKNPFKKLGGERMGRQKQPVEILMLNGRKHLTKAEIQERKETEIHAACDAVTPPTYLTAKQKKEFTKTASELLDIGVMSNLDIDSLAGFFVARDEYLKLTKILKKADLSNTATIDYYSKMASMQDKAYKRMRAAAGDNGLTITSRCKIAAPKKQKEKPINKYDKFIDTG